MSDHLLVYDTKNLRIVDASILPLEPLGNIQPIVYAMAEKAADLTIEDRRKWCDEQWRSIREKELSIDLLNNTP